MKQIILLIFLLFGFLTINAQELKKAAMAIGCKQVNEQDYNYNKMNPDEFDKWKKDGFNAQSQTSFAAKCSASDGLRYTFWFEEETYADEKDAEARLSKSRQIPPQLQKEYDDFDGKTLSEYIFRDSFRRGLKVYIFSSKVYKLALEDAFSPIRKKLERKIK